MERHVIIIIANVAIASYILLTLAFIARINVFLLLFLTTITLSMVPLGLIIICCLRRNPKSKGEDLMIFDLGTNLNADSMQLTDAGILRNKKDVDGLPLFSFSSVSAATNNFSATNILGKGGFGIVYKGVLVNGDEVAVKRLSRKSKQGLEELKNEVLVIAKVQHKNLVRILGYCIDRDEKILIYEYMPNKSLDFFLFDPTKCNLLDLKTRVRIIEGIAQGLLYLHQYSRVRIIHRDLKASNILLDKDMNPKISDFGMARILFGDNELEANTSRIVGTFGYMAPEYALEGIFSIKSDVFSFGVLLLEILSGKKTTGFYHRASFNLVYAWDLWTSNKATELIDPIVLLILEDTSSKHTLLRYVNISLLCVQERAEDRPTMSDVVSMLTNEVVPILTPKPPAFPNVRNTNYVPPSGSRQEYCSINEVTITLIGAR